MLGENNTFECDKTGKDIDKHGTVNSSEERDAGDGRFIALRVLYCTFCCSWNQFINNCGYLQNLTKTVQQMVSKRQKEYRN